VGTYNPKPGEIERSWHVIDANDVVLGRLASQAAKLLRGKHKAHFALHVDTGDFVVIINAAKVAVSGAKRDEFRYRHSGYPGGLSKRTVGELLESKPQRVIELAVKGMLPRNRLARKQLTKLKVYAGPDHPHAAQQPAVLEIETR
jgi:large subunit ribosomal protein L13